MESVAEENLQNENMEEDELVAELPVFLNCLQDDTFTGDLCVIQYPLRPRYRPYGDQGNLTSVEYHEESKQFRMKYNISDYQNYDRQSPDYRPSHHYLTTTTPFEIRARDGCAFAVGCIHDGKMTMTPVRQICQMKNDLSHCRDEKTFLAEEMEEEKTEVQNPWEDLDFFDRDSAESCELFIDQFLKSCNSTGNLVSRANLEFNLEDFDYLESLCSAGKSKGNIGSIKKLQNETGQVRQLTRLSLVMQIEEIAQANVVFSFDTLKSSLPPNSVHQNSDDKLIECLNTMCYIVQGNFVLRADKSPELCSKWHVKCRELLLLLFEMKGKVSRPQFMSVTKLGGSRPDELLKAIGPVAVLSQPDRQNQTQAFWELKCKRDESFITAYSDVCEEHHQGWMKKQDPLMQFFRDQEAQRKALSERDVVDVVNQKIANVVKILASHGAQTLQDLKTQLKENDESLLPVLDELSLQNRISQTRSLYMLRNTGDPVIDRYRLALLNLYHMGDGLKKSDIDYAFEEEFGVKTSLTDMQFRRLLKEFCTKDARGRWFFRGTPLEQPDQEMEETN